MCGFLLPQDLNCWSRTSCVLGLAWCVHSHAKLREDELLCGKGLVPAPHMSCRCFLPLTGPVATVGGSWLSLFDDSL